MALCKCPLFVSKKKFFKAPKSLPAPFSRECTTNINLRACACDPAADRDLGRQRKAHELVSPYHFYDILSRVYLIPSTEEQCS